MSTESGIEKLFERSRFIFRGKVLKVGTSNLKSLKAEERTAVVGVEKVYRAAPALQALAGTEVTVLLQTPGSVAEGQSTVFFTNGWQYGERVAVREEGHLEGSDIPERVGLMLNWHERSHLRERTDAATAVIVGVVQGLAAAQPGERQRSEHDPIWWKATLVVSSVLKGKAEEGSTVEVYFANSKDIAWYKTPKFHPGDRGVVLLVVRMIKGIAGEHFVADDPRDFLPLDRLEDIRDAIGSESRGAE